MKYRLAMAVMLCWLPQAHAQFQPVEIGRLFTTAEERRRLDDRRAGGAEPSAAQQAAAAAAAAAAQPATPAPAPPPPAPLVVNGVVQRSDGRTTVWVNQAAQENLPLQMAPGSAAPAVALPLANGASAAVKPGQQVDPVTGAVSDAAQQP